MAQKKSPPAAQEREPRLTVPRLDAEQRLRERIDAGRVLEGRQISGPDDLQAAEREQAKWHDYNQTLLRRLFDTRVIAEEYEASGYVRMVVFARGPNLGEDIQDFQRDLRGKLNKLESIAGRLELYPEPTASVAHLSAAGQMSLSSNSKSQSTAVFIVHGHDHGARDRLARFVELVGLESVVLDEQADEGLTVVEKFEKHADRVGYALVALTPDDTGASKANPDHLRDRARQNVVFELGFFAGRLGRGRVGAVLTGDVEIPSDYAGVLYTRLDADGGWMLKIARNLAAAGLPVDMRRILEG